MSFRTARIRNTLHIYHIKKKIKIHGNTKSQTPMMSTITIKIKKSKVGFNSKKNGIIKDLR